MTDLLSFIWCPWSDQGLHCQPEASMELRFSILETHRLICIFTGQRTSKGSFLMTWLIQK